MTQRPWHSIDEEADHLVALNHSEVPSIIRSYVFPDPTGETIRVVHVDREMFPEDHVIPIHFSNDPQYRLYHPMYIAIVDPSAPEKLAPPEGWGSWDGARIIERRRGRKAG